MSQVLVIEQRQPPRAATELEAEGFDVLVAVHLQEALAVFETVDPDLILVEGNASHESVRSLCAALRLAAFAPLALLSQPCPERDAVAALGSGVDVLVLEPVGRYELIARVRSMLRRNPRPRVQNDDVITVGPVLLDCARREAFVNGQHVRVPRREFDIALLLMREAGRVVPREKILHELWGSLRDTKSLDVQVGRLRARLAAAEGRRRIVTVRGVGYRFLTDDDPQLESASHVHVERDVMIDLRVVLNSPASKGLDGPEVLEGSAPV